MHASRHDERQQVVQLSVIASLLLLDSAALNHTALELHPLALVISLCCCPTLTASLPACLSPPCLRHSQVDGDLHRTSRFIDRLRIPYIAPSLGGVESLVEQTAIGSYWCGCEDEEGTKGRGGKEGSREGRREGDGEGWMFGIHRGYSPTLLSGTSLSGTHALSGSGTRKNCFGEDRTRTPNLRSSFAVEVTRKIVVGCA